MDTSGKLEIYDNALSKSDEGEYFCSDSSESVESQHILSTFTVFIADPGQVEVAARGKAGSYEWDEWQTCNLCGQLPGQKRRFGFDKKNRVFVQYQDCHVACKKTDDELRGYRTVDPRTLDGEIPELEKGPNFEIVAVSSSSTSNVILNCDQMAHNHGKRAAIAWLFDMEPVRFMSTSKQSTSEIYVDGYDRLRVSGLASSSKSQYDIRCYVNQRLAKEIRLVINHDLDMLELIQFYFDIVVYGILAISSILIIIVMMISMMGLWRYNKS